MHFVKSLPRAIVPLVLGMKQIFLLLLLWTDIDGMTGK
jgi:hypothetical protein